MVKIIAYYLPQYHEIPENNEWWGKGFTEWTNVKNCKPVFKGQKQPKVPLNNNYYDLMNKETIEWQTKLANDYGIYGFCYFHYWFKNGRKILEKPAENILKWKNIPQRFCFFWANCQWQRTWSNTNVGGTTWVSDDKRLAGDSKEILLEQDYGTEKDWTEHFYYCLEFFKDDRYIKINNKPFFAIYNLNLIDCAEPMFALWNSLAKQNGFDGIHFVSVNQDGSYNPYIEASLQYGGGTFSEDFFFAKWNFIRNCMNFFLKKVRLEKYSVKNIWNYSFIWHCILRTKPFKKIHTYPGAEVKYDETPRRGRKALIFRDASPELFGKFFKKQLTRCRCLYHSDYIFLDAWNEWGEGNYLEPDQEYGYGFLEALKNSFDSQEK